MWNVSLFNFYVYLKSVYTLCFIRISLNIVILLIGNVAVAFLYYKSIGPLLSSSDNFLLKPQNYDNCEEEERVISSVISVSMSSNPPTLYELEKITFTLSHLKVSCFSGSYWLWLWYSQRSGLFVVSHQLSKSLSLKIQIWN